MNKINITNQTKIGTFVNGKSYERGDMQRARQILINANIYNTLGNFGPYLQNKIGQQAIVKEIFVIENFEFIIVEKEVMNFDIIKMQISKPFKQKEAWFQIV